MKLNKVILSVITAMSMISINVQSFTHINVNAAEENETYGIVTYDALTGIETYREIGLETADFARTLYNDVSVMERSEIRFDNPRR